MKEIFFLSQIVVVVGKFPRRSFVRIQSYQDTHLQSFEQPIYLLLLIG